MTRPEMPSRDNFFRTIWSYFVHRYVAAGGFMLGGVLIAISRRLRLGQAAGYSWSESVVYTPEIGLGLFFVAVGAGSLAGRAFDTVRAHLSERPLKGRGGIAEAGRAHYFRRARWVGFSFLIFGVAVFGALWVRGLYGGPAGRTVVYPGQTVRAYETALPDKGGTKALEVALPFSIGLQKLESVQPPRAKLEVTAKTRSGPGTRIFQAGDRIELEGKQITFVGLEAATDRYVAILERKNTDGPPVAVGPGQSVPDGGEASNLTVKKVVDDYRDHLGPAAKIAPEGQNPYWVFQKGKKGDRALELGHPVELVGLERQLGVVISVSDAVPTGLLSVGWWILLIGAAVLFGERAVGGFLSVPSERKGRGDDD